jgi:hypothetical protein
MHLRFLPDPKLTLPNSLFTQDHFINLILYIETTPHQSTLTRKNLDTEKPQKKSILGLYFGPIFAVKILTIDFNQPNNEKASFSSNNYFIL